MAQQHLAKGSDVPNDRQGGMGVNINGRVRVYIILYAVIIMFTIWVSEFNSLIAIILGSDPQKAEWGQKLLASLVTAISAGALFSISFGRDIDLHNVIDRSFFHVRTKTGAIIRHEMIAAAQRVGAAGWKNMQNNPKEVMYVFYHFVNQQDRLRAIAFTYWEQFFVNIYVILFGLITGLITSIVTLARGGIGVELLAPLLCIFIVTVVAWSTFDGLVPKIYELPIQQVREIYVTKPDELRQEIDKRFASVTFVSGAR